MRPRLRADRAGPVGILDQQCNSERTLLWRRQRGQNVGQQVAHEVGEPREGKLDLGAAGPGGED